MISAKKICNIYLCLLVLYYLQGSLYEEGTVVGRIILVLAMTIGTVCAAKVLYEYKLPRFFTAVNLFLAMIAVYGVVYIYDGPIMMGDGRFTTPLTYIKNPLISFLPIYAFYYFTKKGVVTERWICTVSVIAIALCIVQYYVQMELTITARELKGIQAEEVTNNSGYLFLTVIPLLVLFYRNRLIQFALMAVILAFVVMTMKRGAILVGACCLVYFIWNTFRRGSSRDLKIILPLTVALFVGGYYLISYMLETSEYFQYRVLETLEGNMSGRDIIYAKLFDYIRNECSSVEILFGSGADYSVVIAGNFAHNDWLELLVDCGLLGVTIYAFYFAALYKSILGLPSKNAAKPMACLCLFILSSRSLFSMSYGDLFFPLALALGYSLAQTGRKRMVRGKLRRRESPPRQDRNPRRTEIAPRRIRRRTASL